MIVTTTNRERIRPTFGLDAGTQLYSATLNHGEKAEGAVIFDVPRPVSSASLMRGRADARDLVALTASAGPALMPAPLSGHSDAPSDQAG
ncbi:MAG TPA: hypothetical protein VI357_14345 [Mycobacteriales bacterium]